MGLDEKLRSIVYGDSFTEEAKEFAKSILTKWEVGIIPSPKSLKKLEKLTARPVECGHIQRNGSCGWLRVYGQGYDLPVPPAGIPAKCAFPTCQHKCPGYKK